MGTTCSVSLSSFWTAIAPSLSPYSRPCSRPGLRDSRATRPRWVDLVAAWLSSDWILWSD
jgi:hypothetical protein